MDEEEKRCFPDGILVAEEAARKLGKPLLTAGNLNKLTTDAAGNKALAAQAIKDLPAFLEQHFYLTPAQQNFVRSMKLDPSLENGIREMAAHGGTINFGNPVATPAYRKGSVSFEIPGIVKAGGSWESG
jgi:hypothetical protein